ncbi:hypothetical protein N9O88_01000 [bacterium]|nr:hypothetical protein [bacterium]
MIKMPVYNDKTEPIYSVIIVNFITLGGCSLISFFKLNDIILSLLFQIIAANNNQGFLNKIYSYKWHVIDCSNALVIALYGYLNYKLIIPKIIMYSFFPLLVLSCFAQSISISKKDYIYLVNIWHLLIFNYINILSYFKDKTYVN